MSSPVVKGGGLLLHRTCVFPPHPVSSPDGFSRIRREDEELEEFRPPNYTCWEEFAFAISLLS